MHLVFRSLQKPSAASCRACDAPRGRSSTIAARQSAGVSRAARAAGVGVCLAILAMGQAIADDDISDDGVAYPPRIRVAPESGTETDIRDCLREAVDAANAENLDGFVACFTTATRSKLRKPVALRFVQYDVTMELLDSQVITLAATTAELAVKYRLELSDDRYDVVSLVAMKEEQGTWRINSERILSYDHDSPGACSPSRYACFGATCGVRAGR
jgi:hypothetical protein